MAGINPRRVYVEATAPNSRGAGSSRERPAMTARTTKGRIFSLGIGIVAAAGLIAFTLGYLLHPMM